MRARLLIAIALGAAVGGVVVFYGIAQRGLELPHALTGPGTVRVIVAKWKLDFGTQLAPKDLQWVEWPKAAVPPGSFTSVEALLGEKGDEKRVILRTIEPGEPVLESKISKLGELPRTAMSLGEGKRAVAISVDASAGVAGFVAPGDRVDIMLIRRIEAQLVSSIIMQDVLVIAVEDRPDAGAEGQVFRMVTVKVGIEEAQKLALAQQVGRLALTLRGIGAGDPAPTVPRHLPSEPKGCKRPWSGYRDIPENILRPNLCRSSLNGIIGPALGSPREPVRVHSRGDFGVPRGLCDRPPTTAPGGTLCDSMDFPPWAP